MMGAWDVIGMPWEVAAVVVTAGAAVLRVMTLWVQKVLEQAQ